jgi:sodium-coupled monocarboxylate transporter 8/12
VAIVIYAPSLVITAVTGLPLKEGILFMGVLTTAYSAAGGMRAIIWTDVMQFITIVVGLIALVWTASTNIVGTWSETWSLAQSLGKTKMLDFSFDLEREFTVAAVLFGSGLYFLNTFGVDQVSVQRYLTARSLNDCKKALRLKALISFLMAIALAGVGILLSVYYAQHPEEAQQIVKGDAVLAYFAVTKLPAGLAGLVIAALLAAAMSTLSGGVNSLTAVSIVDFYRRLWKPDASEAHYTRLSRAITIAWGALATTGALFAEHLGELFIAYAKVNSFLGGVVLAVFLLGMLTRRARATPTLAGAAIGLTAVVWISTATNVSWLWYAVVGCLTTFLSGLFLSYLTPQPGYRITGEIRNLG